MKNLEIEVQPGFVIYRNGPGPVWICPHSGPAMSNNSSRDNGSDVIASMCWLKTGGTMIISSIPRDKLLGLDFNRTLPPKDMALFFFQYFVENKDASRKERYKQEYAFVAKDEDDYKKKRAIYENFWDTVRKSGKIIIFMHREYTQLKNFPSAMDVITYRGEGMSRDIASAIVAKINGKYEDFLRHAEKHYKNSILMEEIRFVDEIKRKYGRFDKDLMEPQEIERVENAMKIIKKLII